MTCSSHHNAIWLAAYAGKLQRRGSPHICTGFAFQACILPTGSVADAHHILIIVAWMPSTASQQH